MSEHNINIYAIANNIPRAWWNGRVARLVEGKPYRLASTFRRLEDAFHPDFIKTFMATLGDEFEIKESGIDYEPLELSLSLKSRKDFKNFLGINKDESVIFVFSSDSGEDARIQFFYTEQSQEADLKLIIDKLDLSLPRKPEEPECEDKIYIKFWYMSKHGPTHDVKELSCPKLDTILDNYTPEIQKVISEVAKMEDPDKNGKILLWQGEPGTGKTYAIRALAREWFKNIKASVEYILDPEVLFSSTEYMYNLLISGANSEFNGYDRLFENERVTPVGSNTPDDKSDLKLRLIIIEDAAALFGDGCRLSPGFSRFLNLTDGIIGQGSTRTVFMLTANEDVGEIDPAIRRKGRCMGVSVFNEFSLDQAKNWLTGKDASECAMEKLLAEAKDDRLSWTLADLYSIINNTDLKDTSSEPVEVKGFGFG